MDQKKGIEKKGHSNTIEEYQAYVQERLDALLPVFAAAAVGDFSATIKIPEDDDRFSEIYAGIEILLEVVRKRIQEIEIARLEAESERAKDDAILSSIADGMLVTDDEGKITLVNKPMEEMFGWKSDEILGRYAPSVYIAEDEKNKQIFNSINTSIQAGKIFSISGYMGKRDRSMLPVAISAAPVILGGRVTGAIILVRDVTKEREVDKAKNEFVALASHQLRTPLSIINWYTDGLLTGTIGKTEADKRKYLEGIYRANRRMIELVDALLSVSRIDLGTLSINNEPVNFQEIADSALSEFVPQIKTKKFSIEKNYDTHLPLVKADRKFVRVIFENLLSNAVKYTPEGGTIKVSIGVQGKDLLIRVADTGYGIPLDQQTKIFTKLFRADNVRERETDGTGLGLYIVKSVVEQSGGKIWFESEENKGTTFYVTIPLKGMGKKEGTREVM